MLRKYRSDFVLLNTLTVGIVLVITLSFLGTQIYRNDYDDLRNVMTMMVRPWNAVADELRTDEESLSEEEGTSQPAPQPRENSKPPAAPQRPDKPAESAPGTNGQAAPAKPPKPESSAQPDEESVTERSDNDSESSDTQRRRSRSSFSPYKNDHISVYIYDRNNETVSLLSEYSVYEGEDELQLMKEITSRKTSFGTVDDQNIIYYRERTQSGTYKIAIAGKWYMSNALWRIVLILLPAFLVSMGLVFLVSMPLSRRAARPMEKAIGMERQFVRDISHDLKTPVTVILANNSILRADPQARVADNIQWIESTDSAARDMMDMVNEMLTLSRLEGSDIKSEKELVELSAEAEKTVLQLESVAYENRIGMETDIEEKVFVSAVPEYTRRICSSLIENAVKYEPVGGSVRVTVCSSRKKAILIVHNKLSFIPGEDIEHIFESFYRSDKTRGSKGGHGLGLTIIKRMAELSGADITVKSAENEGTTFTVTFNGE